MAYVYAADAKSRISSFGLKEITKSFYYDFSLYFSRQKKINTHTVL